MLLSFSQLVWCHTFIWYFDMAEMKGHWLKLPSYRKINALVHKYPGSFTKRMFPDVLSPKRSYQSWVDSGEGLKGYWPSGIPNFRPRCLEREQSTVLANRPGASQAGKESDRIGNQTEK